MSLYFPIEINSLTYYLIGASLVLTVVLFLWFLMRFLTIKKGINRDYNFTEEKPGASIIVYAKNDADYLAQFLPIILNQDYPNFEVIVVNDGSTDATKDLLSDFEMRYSNLYQTFAPEDTRSVSRKKLSVMLGIKAAKYDYIINTNANCQPQTDQWIAAIMRNFTKGVDVVIGHAHPIYKEDRGIGRWFRSFHFLQNCIQYLVYAINGKPYRGTNDNLAYRKQTFFNNKGFSHSMNLHYGDDDVFVSEIANEDNTRVELSSDSILIAHYYDVAEAFVNLKLRYDFTSRYLHTTAFAQSSFISFIYILDFLAIAGIIAIDYINPLNYAIAVGLLLMLTLPQIIIYRKTAKIMQSIRLFFSVPLFSLLYPFINLWYKIKGRRARTLNFTWQR